MWNIVTPSGIATATVDLTNDLSLLLIGLVGLVWVCAGFLAWEAIRYYIAQPTISVTEAPSASGDIREAA